MAKQKIKVDPITQAKNAVATFENMINALDYLNTTTRDMINFNLDYAKKQLASLEEKEEALLKEKSPELFTQNS